MGSNNNQNTQQKPTPPPGAIPQSGGLPSSFSGNTPMGTSANPPAQRPLTGSPMNSSQNFVQNTQDQYNSQQNPLMNQAAYGYGQATQNDATDRGNIMSTYQNRYGLTPSGGGGGTVPTGGGGALNQRLPGESSYDWTKRVATATGRSDIANDPGALQYWADSINSKPQSGDMGYWIDKFTGGGGGGGGGGFGGGGYASAQYAGLAQAGPAAQAGYTSAGSAAQAGTQYSGAPRMLDMTKLGKVTPSDPYASYAGFQEFSNTGGYSPADIANMRARGIAPIRAAYANAERNVGQQRSLQGGYSPNAIAAQVKMARDQGQSMADASQNVEAGIADARNRGRISGLTGMSDIEHARQAAQMQGDIFNATQGLQGQEFDIGNELQNSQFNAGQGNQVGMYNAGQTNQMGQFNAGQANQVGMYNTGQTNQRDEFNTGQANQVGMFNAGQGNQVGMYNAGLGMQGMQGMTSLYGTTPGMSSMFGTQALGALNSNAGFSGSAMGAFNQANALPDAYSQNMTRIGQAGNLASGVTDALGTGINAWRSNQVQQPPYEWQGPVQQPDANYQWQGPVYQPPANLAQTMDQWRYPNSAPQPYVNPSIGQPTPYDYSQGQRHYY